MKNDIVAAILVLLVFLTSAALGSNLFEFEFSDKNIVINRGDAGITKMHQNPIELHRNRDPSIKKPFGPRGTNSMILGPSETEFVESSRSFDVLRNALFNSNGIEITIRFVPPRFEVAHTQYCIFGIRREEHLAAPYSDDKAIQKIAIKKGSPSKTTQTYDILSNGPAWNRASTLQSSSDDICKNFDFSIEWIAGMIRVYIPHGGNRENCGKFMHFIHVAPIDYEKNPLELTVRYGTEKKEMILNGISYPLFRFDPKEIFDVSHWASSQSLYIGPLVPILFQGDVIDHPTILYSLSIRSIGDDAKKSKRQVATETLADFTSIRFESDRDSESHSGSGSDHHESGSSSANGSGSSGSRENNVNGSRREGSGSEEQHHGSSSESSSGSGREEPNRGSGSSSSGSRENNGNGSGSESRGSGSEEQHHGSGSGSRREGSGSEEQYHASGSSSGSRENNGSGSHIDPPPHNYNCTNDQTCQNCRWYDNCGYCEGDNSKCRETEDCGSLKKCVEDNSQCTVIPPSNFGGSMSEDGMNHRFGLDDLLNAEYTIILNNTVQNREDANKLITEWRSKHPGISKNFTLLNSYVEEHQNITNESASSCNASVPLFQAIRVYKIRFGDLYEFYTGNRSETLGSTIDELQHDVTVFIRTVLVDTTPHDGTFAYKIPCNFIIRPHFEVNNTKPRPETDSPTSKGQQAKRLAGSQSS